LNLLEAGNGGAAGRLRYALAPLDAALLSVHLDLAVILPLASTSTAVIVSDLLEIVFLAESARRRPAALTLADRKRNGHVWREAVLVDLLALESLNITVAWKWAAVKSVQGRLTAHELWSGRSSPGWRWSRLPPINVDINVDVLVDDRFATVGSKCLVGYFRWSRFIEKVVAAARRSLAEEVVLVVPLPLHDARSTAGAVLVEIDIAVVARAFVVLLEAEVVVVVSSASISATSAAAAITASWRTSSHAFKPRAIPALASSSSATTRRRRRIIISVQRSCGGTTVHGCGGGLAHFALILGVRGVAALVDEGKV
jgi:hypothetical protein